MEGFNQCKYGRNDLAKIPMVQKDDILSINYL